MQLGIATRCFSASHSTKLDFRAAAFARAFCVDASTAIRQRREQHLTIGRNTDVAGWPAWRL
eukprot:997691-Amphidinium_carterae.1